VVPHLDTTAALSSDSGAGPAFIIGLLSVNDKRGSNRGNDKRSYYSCNGGGTSLAFVVGLLDVDSKRGGNRGAGSGGGTGPAFVAGRLASRSRTRWAVGRQQGATGAHYLRALREGVRLRLVRWFLATDAQGHPEW